MGPRAKPKEAMPRMESFSIVERQLDAPDVYCAARRADTFPDFNDVSLRSQSGPQAWIGALSIAPISAVSWIWTPKMSVGPRRLNDSMWFWFETIEGWARVGDSGEIPLSDHTLLLIPRGVEHEIHHGAETVNLKAVHFQSTVYGGVSFLDIMGFPYFVHATSESVDLFRSANVQLAREFAVKSVGWHRAMESEIMRVLFHIMRTYSRGFRTGRARAMQQELLRLLPSLEWLDEHLQDPNVRIAAMAARINVCESQFRKLFQSAIGISPVRFIQRQRVERACSLLITTGPPSTIPRPSRRSAHGDC